MKFLFKLFIFMSPLVAHSETTKVFFVGGYASSEEQMRCWESGARKNSPGDYEFEGVAYPPQASSDFAQAVAGARPDITRIVKEINANPTRRYVVAGHSSGCAIANTIATLVSHPERIKQVVLDGFTTPRIAGAACWGALGEDGKGSRNYSAMATCGAGRHTYNDTHCSASSEWCLHFSLVMKSTPSDLVDFHVHGYDGCDTNLDWLQ